jgi:hypothetical protein
MYVVTKSKVWSGQPSDFSESLSSFLVYDKAMYEGHLSTGNGSSLTRTRPEGADPSSVSSRIVFAEVSKVV